MLFTVFPSTGERTYLLYHVLAELHQNHRGLSAGSGALRIQHTAVLAAHQAVAHSPLNRLNSPAGHLVGVGEAVQFAGSLGLAALQRSVLPQNGGQLLTEAAQFTASAYQAPAFTSSKALSALTSGRPSRLYRI